MHMILTKDKRAEIMINPVTREIYRRELSAEEFKSVNDENLKKEKLHIVRNLLNADLSDNDRIEKMADNGIELHEMIPLILECV